MQQQTTELDEIREPMQGSSLRDVIDRLNQLLEGFQCKELLQSAKAAIRVVEKISNDANRNVLIKVVTAMTQLLSDDTVDTQTMFNDLLVSIKVNRLFQTRQYFFSTSNELWSTLLTFQNSLKSLDYQLESSVRNNNKVFARFEAQLDRQMAQINELKQRHTSDQHRNDKPPSSGM